MSLSELVADSEIRINTVFALACFCTFAGFVAAVSLYGFYGFWLQKDLPMALADITKWFIGQSVGGGLLAWLGKSSDKVVQSPPGVTEAPKQG